MAPPFSFPLQSPQDCHLLSFALLQFSLCSPAAPSCFSICSLLIPNGAFSQCFHLKLPRFLFRTKEAVTNQKYGNM